MKSISVINSQNRECRNRNGPENQHLVQCQWMGEMEEGEGKRK